MVSASGVVYVHSAPTALCPHIEWALARVLRVPARLHWDGQPVEPGTWRGEFTWTGPAGTSAALASALLGCQRARFEVTEDPTTGGLGERYAFTPRLGMFHATTAANGDIMISEQRLRAAVAANALGEGDLGQAVGDLLGADWDEELEIFRQGGVDGGVRWLNRAG